MAHIIAGNGSIETSIETRGAKEIVGEETHREEVRREGKVKEKEDERACISQGSAEEQDQ